MALAALLGAAASCAGAGGLLADNAGGPLLLASPDRLEASSMSIGSFDPADRFKAGAQYAAQPPSSLVAPEGEAARFSPEWLPGGDPATADPAYALYRFILPGYAGESSLAWRWAQPVPAGDAWLGLADWQRNAWQWHALAGGSLDLPSLADHFDEQGRLVAAVVLLGAEPAELDWLRVGENIPPQAMLTASQYEAEPGTEVDFDAALSVDLDDAIALYEWDLDGDGHFETSTGTTPAASRVFDAPGNFDVSVRAEDSHGAHGTATRTIAVGGPLATFTDFEDGWDGWQPDVTDVFVSPGDEIDWTLELSQELAYSGDTSVLLTAENRTDACKLWIERQYDVEPLTTYHVTLDYRFASSIGGEVGAWTILAGGLHYDPEDRIDLLDVGQMARESTYNGGSAEYIWLAKHYEFDVTAGASGEIWVVAGVWGVFEVRQTYYIDDVAVTLAQVDE